MKRIMIALTFVMMMAALSWSQTWVRNTVSDPLSQDKSGGYVSYTLTGKFLSPPSQSHLSAPIMDVRCQPGHQRKTNGRFVEMFIDTGAIIEAVPRVEVKWRVDSEKVHNSPNWGVSSSHTALAAGGVLGEYELADMIYTRKSRDTWNGNKIRRGMAQPSHQLIIGVQEYSSGEIEMQFEFPDVGAIADDCGLVER